ncbi:MAG: glycosyltransferase family 4 protein [Haliea sp.]|nr:glycosyltransferase family 4 protein [Haliea sp.]
MGLRDDGFRVDFAQPRATHHLIDDRQSGGIRHHWLPTEQLYDLTMPALSLRDAAPAASILRECAPDLVLFADGCPLSSLAAKGYCHRHGIPFLVLVHCVYEGWQHDFAEQLPALAQCYQHALEVIAVSKDNLQLLRDCFALGRDKGRVIYNGRPASFFSAVDPEQRQQQRKAMGLGPDSVLCLSVGRMEPVKGYQYQLEAMRALMRCPGWMKLHFLWVGTGTQQQRLLRVARLLAGDRMHHLNEHTDMPGLLGAADLLLHTSRFEGMPLVVLEAMARRLPVVATAVSGIPEALADTGVLLSSPTSAANLPREIANAVCSLTTSAHQRARSGQAAAARAQAMFREEDMLQHYRQLVTTLMAGLQ